MDAVDLSQKVKETGDGNAQFVTEGNKIYFIDARGVKRRLITKKPTDPVAMKNASRARAQRAMRGVLPSDYTKDDPDSDDQDVDSISAVVLPRKVREFKSYYDPRTKRDGKAPPKSEDHKDKQSAVRDQGSRGLCSAFATTAALERSAGVPLSVEYAYWLYNDKSVTQVCTDDGANMTDITEGLDGGAIPEESKWPYTDLDCPHQDAPSEAKKFATFQPQHIYPLAADPEIRAGTGKRTLSAAVNDPRLVESVLAAGYDLVYGINWPTQPRFREELATGDVVDVKLNAKGKPYDTKGGHYMLAVGYERTGSKKLGGGYVVFKNSYGTGSGKDGYVKLSYDFLRLFGDDGVIFTGSLKVGEGGACYANTQCRGFDKVGAKGSACCGKKDDFGTCRTLEKDWAGVYYCPNECVGRAGASPGTCGLDGLKDDGESCKVSADCEGFEGAGQPGSACCGGICTETRRDYAGVNYCPNECRASAKAAPGSCDEGADSGDACKTNADCKNFSGLGKKGDACCNGKCQATRKDFAGVYYCKQECRGAAGASAGTCPLKKKNKACSVSADCASGRSCCAGKCKAKKTDWAGVDYCPDECVGKVGGKKGSCD